MYSHNDISMDTLPILTLPSHNGITMDMFSHNDMSMVVLVVVM